MLKATKKLTKKDIKEDAIVSSYGNMILFLEEKKAMLGYVALAIVVLTAGIAYYIYNRNANNEKAASELGKIFSYYDAGASDPAQYQIAINGAPDRNLTGLKSIVENYSSTKSGNLAKLYLANAYYGSGNVDEALRLFGDFSSSDPLLNASAAAGEGACYEAKQNYEQAASMFEKAAGMQSINSPEYLLSAARCYSLKGNNAKALELCKRIKREFPKSLQARDIDRFISQYSS